jgi:hypothetical protein
MSQRHFVHHMDWSSANMGFRGECVDFCRTYGEFGLQYELFIPLIVIFYADVWFVIITTMGKITKIIMCKV